MTKTKEGLKDIKSHITRFCSDEQGQTSVEYVLFMGILGALILIIGRGLVSRIRDLAQGRLMGMINGQFLGTAGSREQLYHFRFLR